MVGVFLSKNNLISMTVFFYNFLYCSDFATANIAFTVEKKKKTRFQRYKRIIASKKQNYKSIRDYLPDSMDTIAIIFCHLESGFISSFVFA